MNFRKYRLRKTWLDKCLKSPISEHPSAVNMLKGPKHFLNLHDSILSYFSSLWGKLTSKMFLLVIYEI